MLSDSPTYAVLPAKDASRLKNFLSEKLGLEPAKEEMGMYFYETGGSKFFVYPTEFAGTNKATAICFDVQNIETLVKELQGKGVTFEHYEMEGITDNDGVHVMEGTPVKSAWFKDTEGNIISLTQYK